MPGLKCIHIQGGKVQSIIKHKQNGVTEHKQEKTLSCACR